MITVTLLTKDSHYKIPLYEEVESVPEKSLVGNLAITKFHSKVILYTQDGWKQLAKAQEIAPGVWVALEESCPVCKRAF